MNSFAYSESIDNNRDENCYEPRRKFLLVAVYRKVQDDRYSDAFIIAKRKNARKEFYGLLNATKIRGKRILKEECRKIEKDIFDLRKHPVAFVLYDCLRLFVIVL